MVWIQLYLANFYLWQDKECKSPKAIDNTLWKFVFDIKIFSLLQILLEYLNKDIVKAFYEHNKNIIKI